MGTQETKQAQRTVKLGSTGPEVYPLGLGCMGMSGMYGASDDAEGIRTIQTAIDRGVTLIDTGDFYGMGHNELLVGRAIAGRRERVQLSVKFGALRGPDNSWGGVDTRPAAVKNFAAYSLKRLGVDVIDIYRPARLDPAVPIEDTIGAIADLVKAGYVRHIGLSEVGVETLRRAHKVHPIVDLQIEYSLASRGPEADIFPVLKELGISATLYGVLSRGLLSGSKPKGQGDFRAYLPRFTGANREKNEGVVAALQRFAQERRMTPGQLAIAWVLAKQPGFVPVVGSRTVAQLEDALGALGRPLSQEDLAALESLGSISGERYAPEQMRHLDSERR
ncbi:aldo/keto reductase [Pyxidicoccus xibeiensis]|uniref:aldo/keto reductase n=1 Tax=Pyxidicoccus xibeiensis TaxID=2906759 RepID=UPI0020A81BDA|nr:aldo/keto reductase [Pyxidicoccus xibeiensis]MCP3137928.1 aldo/keto reductase [Pyxidicoccus xibeiensis]